jgi:cytochrome c biogenesis protein CcdA
VLTIVSPCILPVLPFVFARADQPFVRSGLPLLVGMAVTFAGVATLAVVGGEWAVEANQYGRIAAIALLAMFGVTLLFPQIADRLTRPLVAAGAWLSHRARAESGSSSPVLSSFLLGVATGFLWAPCAGPILGLALTGAVPQGVNAQTSLLLLAYATGAATSLAVALLIGGRVFEAMKRSLGAGQWIRRGLGLAVLGGVAAIVMGLDTGLLTRMSIVSTSNYEQTLLDLAQPEIDQPSVVMQSGDDDERVQFQCHGRGPRHDDVEQVCKSGVGRSAGRRAIAAAVGSNDVAEFAAA